MLAAATLLSSIFIALLAWMLAGGPWGWVYLLLFACATAPGLPIGFALFGRRHAAGWLSGALAGYGLTAVVMRLPLEAGIEHTWAAIGAWALLTAVTFSVLRRATPLIVLPVWTRRESLALLGTAMLAPALMSAPFENVGKVDELGNRRYRAYFTADFLWHVALTAELSKLDDPPRNPYLARRALNYYWAYFVPPAIISALYPPSAIEVNLLLNALAAGTIFLAALYVAAWIIVPRAGPVGAAVIVTVVAASAEGWHAIATLLSAGRPLADLRELNIDAITSWFLRGLSVDGLPRSLWYTPQHAMACALALSVLPLPSIAPKRQPLVGLFAGLSLGLAVIMSPVLGGTFCAVYGAAALWHGWRERDLTARLLSTAPAAVPAVLGFLWCVANQTFEGAGGSIAFGLSRLAREAPEALLFALGPVLALAAFGIAVGARRHALAAPLIALLAGIFAFYFVTLTAEPIWMGWRAGQIMLVTAPALIAAGLDTLLESGRRYMAVVAVAAALATGLPTTLIDLYNAQDITNVAMGAGFRWTVLQPVDSQAALAWIRDHTNEDAVVQMSVGPRGRETWTRVPSFAERRMAAGRPISLLRTPEYEELSDKADWIFRGTDAEEARRLARSLRVDYLYVDDVERTAFGATIDKFDNPCCFTLVFHSGQAAVYAVK